MKRILFMLIAAIFLGVLGTNAQSANRKGLFIELQGAATIGDVYRSENDQVYLKGGLDIGFNVGYRLATSNHWAFQMKLGLSDNVSAPLLMLPSFLVGMRWTSGDFAGNKSAYIGLNAGAAVSALTQNQVIYVPVDIEAGINLTNKLYLGLFVTPRINCSYHANYDEHFEYKSNKYLKTNSIIGLRIGYRF